MTTTQTPSIDTTSPVRRQLDALNAAQDDGTLLASWIELCRTDVIGHEARRIRAIALDSIEKELVSRGITHEQFDALHHAIWAAEDDDTPALIHCTSPSHEGEQRPGSGFFFVAERRYPTLCIDCAARK